MSPMLLTCVDVVVRERFQRWHVPHLEQLISEYIDYSVNKTVDQARRRGFTYLLYRRLLPQYDYNFAFVENVYYKQQVYMNAMLVAVQRGDLDELRRFDNGIAKTFRFGLLTKLVNAAAEKGHLHVLRWLKKHHDDQIVWTSISVELASQNEHKEVAEWLQSQIQSKVDANGKLADLSSQASTALVKWQQEHGTIEMLALDATVSSHQAQLLDWVYTFNATTFLKYHGGGLCSKSTTAHKNLKTMHQFIHPRKLSNKGEQQNVLYITLIQRDHEAIQWRHGDRSGEQLMHEVMRDAATQGHLEAVMWLHDHSTKGFPRDVMDKAATFGHLHIVHFLHTHRTEGCTTSAMDGAAGNGFLDVVQWLHEHRSEGCTTNAMDYAARSGHLNVLQWLHDKKLAKCTTKAMDFAAARGHLEVLKWLHTYRSEGCTIKAFDEAEKHRHTEVVKWLQENRDRIVVDAGR